MFNRIRSKLSSIIMAASLGLAATFNRNVTVPSMTAAPVKPTPTKSQRRKHRGGIKGIKGTAVSAVHYRLRAA